MQKACHFHTTESLKIRGVYLSSSSRHVIWCSASAAIPTGKGFLLTAWTLRDTFGLLRSLLGANHHHKCVHKRIVPSTEVCTSQTSFYRAMRARNLPRTLGTRKRHLFIYAMGTLPSKIKTYCAGRGLVYYALHQLR